MPIDYTQYVSIGFQVAREKGATFEATQGQIQRGEAPTTEMIVLLAQIWQDNKDEMDTAEDARRILDREIRVS